MKRTPLQRFYASLTLSALVLMQLGTGVFPIPIAPISSANASGFFIEKERVGADENEPVSYGDEIEYRVRIENNDPSKTANARIVDGVPTGTRFISGSNGCSYYSQFDEVICSPQPLAPGRSRTVYLTFEVLTTQTCDVIENIADVWDDDPNAGVPPAWSNPVRTPTACPEIEIGKEVDKSEVKPGDDLKYTLTVTNTGLGAVEDVLITDAIPAGLIFDSGRSSSECNEQAGSIVCSISNINEGRDKDVRIYFDVDDTLTPADNICNDDIDNRAFATARGANQVQSDIVSTYLRCEAPQLEITKTGPGFVTEQDEFTYQITVTNTGNATAEDVEVRDVFINHFGGFEIAPEFDYLSSNGANCSERGGAVECNIGDLTPGESKTFNLRFYATIRDDCETDVFNRAIATADNAPEVSDEHSLHLRCCEGNIHITKTADRTQYEPGDDVTYTITLVSNGPGVAKNVVVTDDVPQNMTFVRADSPCDETGGTVTCDFGNIETGDTVEFDVVFEVDDDLETCGTISNQADVVWSNSGNQSSVASIYRDCPVIDYTIVKRSDSNHYLPGDEIVFFIDIENIGDLPLEDVVVTDPIPSELTFISGDHGCENIGGQITCDPFDVDVSDTETIRLVFEARTDLPTCNPSITNRAYATPSNAQARAGVVTITRDCPVRDFEVRKNSNTNLYFPGDEIIFTVTVENTGDIELEDIVVTDQIPNGLLLTQNDPDCTVGLGRITCDPFDLDVGIEKTFTFVFEAQWVSNCKGSITNRAYATERYGLTKAGIKTITLDCRLPELTLEKDADTHIVRNGDTVTYTLSVENIGDATAENVEIFDPIPTGLTYLDGSSDTRCDRSGNAVTCDGFDLDVNETRELDLVFEVASTAACGLIRNEADAKADRTGNVTAIEDITVDCAGDPELEIDKVADRSQALHLDIVTYTLTVRNIGTETAENVEVQDPLPTHMMYLDSLSDSRCDNPTGNSVECSIGDLEPGESKNIELQFKVLDTAPCEGSIANKADVRADNHQTVWSDTVHVTVICNPDFIAEKSVDKTVARHLDIITYTFEVQNTGNVDLEGIWIIDTIPDNLMFLENNPGTDSRCFQQGNEVKCGDDTIPVGRSDTYTVVFKVLATAPCDDHIDNSAYVVFIGHNNLDGNTNTVRTLVECGEPKLEVEKSADRSTATIGDIILYTLTVRNTGTESAQNVFVIDELINQLDFVGTQSSPECDMNGNIIECGPNDLDPAEEETYTIALRVNQNAQCDTTIYNQAQASADTVDPVLSNTVAVDIYCEPEADIRVEKTGPAQILRGTTIVYKIEVENLGPDTAEDVVIYDLIPDVQVQDSTSRTNLTFDPFNSDSICTEQNDQIACGGFDLAAGQTKFVDIAFEVPSFAHCAKPIINDVVIDALTFDPITSNNDDRFISTVQCATGTLDIFKDGPVTARHGDLITYTITVENNLSFDTTQNRMIDPIPTGLEYVSADNTICDGPVANNEVVCEEFDLDAGDSISFELTFRVEDTAECEPIINIADIWSRQDGIDPQWSNAVETHILCDTDLVIDKTDNRDTATIGDTLTYEILVANIGRADAVDVAIIDELPSDVDFVSATAGGVYNSNDHTVTWIIDIDADDTELLEIQATVASSAQDDQVLFNEVCITDGNICADDETRIIIENPAFRISKTDNRTTARIGDELTYEITVANISAVDAIDAVIIDTLPDDIAFISAEAPTGASLIDGDDNEVEFIADIDAGDIVVFKVTVKVLASATDGQVLLNNICINASPCDDDETTVVIDEIVGCIDVIKETFTANGNPLTPVTQFTFELDGGVATTQNDSLGRARFENLTPGAHNVQEVLPAGWELRSVTPPNGDIIVPVGSNCATVTFKNQQESFVEQPEFMVEKTDHRSLAQPGETLTYEITVTNVSAIDGTDIEIIDVLPDYVTFVSADRGGIFNNGSVTWIADINAFSEEVFEVVVTINQDVQNNTYLLNNVCITNGPCDDDITKVVVEQEIFGCIDVIKETFKADGTVLTPVTQFTFNLDGGVQTIHNNASGRATFENVPVGTHVVTEIVPLGWSQASVAPTNGSVVVSEGSDCATVTFKNRQDPLGSSRLTIEKTDNQSQAAPGDTLTYQITVRNTGTLDETDITVIDHIPTHTTFVSAGNGGTRNGNNVEWTFDLKAGDSMTLTMLVQIDDSASNNTQVFNQACIDGGPCDDDTTVVLRDTPTLSIDKTVNRSIAKPGDELTYTIRVTNTSSTDATDVFVEDTIPSDTDYVSASSGNLRSGDTVRWNFDLAAGQTRTFTLRVSVESSADDGDTIRNTACIVSGPCDDARTDIEVEDDDDEDQDDDDDDDGDVDFSLNGDPDPLDLCRDDEIEYDIRVTNSSNANEEVDIIAYLDSDMEYESSSDGGDESGSRVEWDNKRINRNDSREFRLRVRVEDDVRDGDTVRLRVSVSGAGSETETTRIRNRCDDDDDDTPPPTGVPNLTIDKSARDTALAGDQVPYTITVRNTGNEDITNAVLTDDYPQHQMSIADPGGASDSGDLLTWQLGTLRAGSTTVVRYRVRLDSNLSANAYVRNTATVRGSGITRTDDHTITLPRPPQTGLGAFLRGFGDRDNEEVTESDAQTSGTQVAVIPQPRSTETAIEEVPATSSNLPMMVWMTTMLTGVGMGGLFGRRFLF